MPNTAAAAIATRRRWRNDHWRSGNRSQIRGPIVGRSSGIIAVKMRKGAKPGRKSRSRIPLSMLPAFELPLTTMKAPIQPPRSRAFGHDRRAAPMNPATGSHWRSRTLQKNSRSSR